MEFIMPQQIYNKKILNLEYLLTKYEIYCKNQKADINLINKIIYCTHLSFNNFFKEDITNYQTIKNVSLNLENLEKDYDLFEQNFFKSVLSDILNKDKSKIKQKIFKLPFLSEYVKIIPLKNELDDNKYNNKDYRKKNLKKNKKFAVYNLEMNFIYIYDTNGNIINTIDFYQLFKNDNKTEIIQYESNILLLFFGSKFISISFSNNFQRYETSIYNLTIKSQLNTNINFNYVINSKLRLIKFNEKNIVLLYDCNSFLINFNEHQKNKTIELNSNFNEDYIFEMIPIYYKED